MPTDHDHTDIIGRLAGIAPDGPVATLREARPGLTRASQANYDALFDAVDPVDLNLHERALAGFRAALLSGRGPAREWYRERLVAAVHPGPDARRTRERIDHLVEAYPGGSGWLDPRDRVILRHTDLLTGLPAQTAQADIDALRAGGLTTRAIVTLLQLVAFVAYQVRVVALLRALDQAPVVDGSRPVSNDLLRTDADDEAVQLPAFTRRVVDWVPRIETVDDGDATPEQLEIVAEIAGARKTGRTYWATLAHDPAVLRSRHQLFPETLRDKTTEGGAPAADLELAAVVTSRVTGCVYCASVHARAFVRSGGDADQVDTVLAGDPTGLPARQAAIVALSARLARDPDGFSVTDLTLARSAGLSDLELLDVGHAAAMFAWANRLMLSLGDQSVDGTD
ncbi:MAG TPA: peroxidase-related enzyme [Thermomicrobiales bacterium]|jgi:uncharacterized peroxidase-related enzyme|nr:peroxidase-related enzyme [Thermomicrobiales bacterium]